MEEDIDTFQFHDGMSDGIESSQPHDWFAIDQENSAKSPFSGQVAPEHPTAIMSERRQSSQDLACEDFTEAMERLVGQITAEIRQEIEPKQLYILGLEKRVESLQKENRILLGIETCGDVDETPTSTTAEQRQKLSREEFEHFFPGFEKHAGFLNEAFDGPEGERAVMDLLQSKPEIFKLHNFERWCFTRGLEDLYKNLDVSSPDSMRLSDDSQTSDDEWEWECDFD